MFQFSVLETIQFVLNTEIIALLLRSVKTHKSTACTECRIFKIYTWRYMK